jgi:cell division protein FtsL
MEKILFTTFIAVFLMTAVSHASLVHSNPKMDAMEQIVYALVSP